MSAITALICAFILVIALQLLIIDFSIVHGILFGLIVAAIVIKFKAHAKKNKEEQRGKQPVTREGSPGNEVRRLR